MNTGNQNGAHLLDSISYPMTELRKKETGDLESLSLESLIAHIKENHHDFLREQVSLIQHLAEMALHDDLDRYEYLQEIYDLTCSLLDSIMPHLLKEERIIFPYIEYMEAMVNKGKVPKKPPFGNVEGPVIKMHSDHNFATVTLKKLRDLSHNYLVPEDASDNMRQLYAKLSEMDLDLQTHIRLEDEILFKKALELEAALN